MGVRLDMALGKVLAILTVTFLAEGVNGSPSIQLPVWKQKFLKNLPTLKKTPGSTALLTAQDHGNSYSPYSYSRPSSSHFFSSNNFYNNNYYSTPNRYSQQQNAAVRKPIPFQSNNNRLKPGYPYRTPTTPATTKTTTTKAPNRFRVRP